MAQPQPVRPDASSQPQDRRAPPVVRGALERLQRSSRFVLTSSTFRLALLYMLLVGVSVAILLAFIYWSTAGYMARQSDATIGAEIQGLAEQYRRRGLAGLSAVIAERIASQPDGASIYLLTDPKGTPVIGNLDSWPPAEPDADGWVRFSIGKKKILTLEFVP